MKKITAVLTVVLCLAFATSAYADKRQEAIDLVDKAVAYADANGIEAAFAEMNKADGMFTNAEGMYVFAYDTQGAMAAHYKTNLIGKNLVNKTDPDGKYFRKDILEVAKTAGEGWVDYKYRDKATKLLSDKTTYVKKYKDYVFCCGFSK